jgi:uncharacterized membrane protein YtjA (UPF0391 family)
MSRRVSVEPLRADAVLTEGAGSAPRESGRMLKWALIFLAIALVAGALGLTPIARGAAAISKVLFALFFIGLAIVVILIVLGLMAGQALF